MASNMASNMPNPYAAVAEELYRTVMSQSQDEHGGFTKSFTQQELFDIAPGSITDKKEILPLITYLTKQHLFRTLKQDGGLGWSVRPRDAAKAIKALDKDERLVYEMIEQSHTTGIWLKSIKNKLVGIAQPTIQKITKKLEGERLIKPVKSIKAPAQRVFMLFHLVPSEDVTGNSFFDAGDLDESFRDELLNLIVFHVKSQSWAEGERKRHGRKSCHRKDVVAREDAIVIEDTKEIGTGQKRKRPATNIDNLYIRRDVLGGQVRKHQQSLPSRHKFNPETDFTQLVYRAGTENYPTVEKIHFFLTNSDAIKATKSSSLTVPEVQGCLDVLMWDDKLEKLWNQGEGNWGYRTKRGVTFRQPGQSLFDVEEDAIGTGLTQAPCGRCPVADVCKEGGPVNPKTCVYFEAWLQS